MSPDISGDNVLDYFSSCELLEFVMQKYLPMLKKEGHFVYKFFEGPRSSGMSILLILEYVKHLNEIFKYARRYKPKASRKESREIYFVCIDKL
jgi:23S rRNA U2552 (ribose-2'-O)-methylase RlmE/FtsJ